MINDRSFIGWRQRIGPCSPDFVPHTIAKDRFCENCYCSDLSVAIISNNQICLTKFGRRKFGDSGKI